MFSSAFVILALLAFGQAATWRDLRGRSPHQALLCVTADGVGEASPFAAFRLARSVPYMFRRLD